MQRCKSDVFDKARPPRGGAPMVAVVIVLAMASVFAILVAVRGSQDRQQGRLPTGGPALASLEGGAPAPSVTLKRGLSANG